MTDRFDPILFEVICNALVEATEEMSVSLQRTSHSTNIKTRLDYSCAYVDAPARTKEGSITGAAGVAFREEVST